MTNENPFHYSRQRRDRTTPDAWRDDRLLAELNAAKRRLEYGVPGAAADIDFYTALATARGLMGKRL